MRLNHPKVEEDGRFIVVVGDASMDIARTARLPMLPHATCCAGSAVRFKPGGSARNVAENLARLGWETRLLSVFGNDPPGLAVRTATRRARVDISASLICADRTTTHCMVVSDHAGENFCCIGDTSIAGMLTPEWVMERGEIEPLV